MCAAQASMRERSVLVIDHALKPAQKIRISGGGRCNFTNIHTQPSHFLSANPKFCVSALARYTPQDFIKLVEKHRIAYHEKTLGQLFCDGSSQQIIDMLLMECQGAQMMLNTSITDISKTADGFILQTTKDALACRSLVIATGGKSIPKMGASGFGYQVAKQFGLKVIQPTAALVPLTFEGKMLDYVTSLAGVAVDVDATCNKQIFREALLFTHRGLSGPAVLQISSYWKPEEMITFNLAPGLDVFDLLKKEKATHPKQEVATVLANLLPKRLAQRIAEPTPGKLADLPHTQLKALADAINHWRVIPSGTEGFRTAEVTLGGVDTDALSSQSFETKTVKGLYFIGEVVDVTGHLGGFNFQWAWASGAAAGRCL